MIDKKKALDYVKNYMKESEIKNITSEGKDGYWRPDAKNRFEHTKRVCRYAKTLCHYLDDVNHEIVEIASIFHDVGKFDSDENHAKVSANITKEYLKNEGLDSDTINKICQVISNHSTKTTDENEISNFSLEDKVVIDADLIDETGVMSIIWVAMKQGKNELCYNNFLENLNNKVIKDFDQYINIAHTAKAREILKKNIMLVKGIAHTLESEIKAEIF